METISAVDITQASNVNATAWEAKKLPSKKSPPPTEQMVSKPPTIIRRSPQSSKHPSESPLSKFFNGRRSSSGELLPSDDSHCTGATSLMTESTTSVGTLPRKFAWAARNIRPLGKAKGVSSFRRKLEASPARSTMSSIEGDFPNANEVEAWMVHPERPIDTINEQVVIENIPEETSSSKQIVIENTPEEATSNKKGKRDKRSKTKQRQSKSHLIQEYEETISKMRTQLSLERRGFAIMALKAKEEKEKMSSQIQDLSWKVTLRGKKVARLEKVVDKCLAEAEQNRSTSVEEKSNMKEINSGQQTEPEKEVNSKGIENLAELLNHELGRWKSSRDEVASNYDELALAVELKCSKLETELNGFKDMIESLNDFNMLKPTAYGCLCESLAELDRVKDEMREFISKNPQGYMDGDPSMIALQHLRSTFSEKKLYISPGSGLEGSTAATSLES